jgi:hypothetical protein
MPTFSQYDAVKAERATTATAGRFWLPTRPYNLVAAANRIAAATGSVRYAQLSAHADYNGHSVIMTLTFHGYWRCGYTWGEQVVLARGSIEQCLRAGAEEYHRGALGAVVRTPELTEDESKVALSLGYIPHTAEGEAAWNDLWYTDLHALVGEAHGNASHGFHTMHHLLAAKDAQDYRLRCQREFLLRDWGAEKLCEMTGPRGERVVVGTGKAGTSREGRACIATYTATGECRVSPKGRILNGSNFPVDEIRGEWRRLRAEGYTLAPAAEARS